jgi:hypothetical protein
MQGIRCYLQIIDYTIIQQGGQTFQAAAFLKIFVANKQ